MDLQISSSVLKFGKHKGNTFEEVRLEDPGYCRWVKKLSDCDGQMLTFQEYLKNFSFSITNQKVIQGPTYEELTQDQEADDAKSELSCVICLTNRRCCVTQPCMHLHYCISCARTLVFGKTGMELKYRGEVQCPDCRTNVKFEF